MVQFNILSGKKAGAGSAARRFPFRIGRSAGNDLQLDDDGIWDEHLTLEFNRQKGFTLATAPNALVTINSGPVQTAILFGEWGHHHPRFRQTTVLAPPAARQRGLRLREAFVWALLAAVTAAQFALIYWLHPFCRKCRVPVKAMAMFRSSAAAMTSASRTEPPG